jgi:hypothetical protein
MASQKKIVIAALVVALIMMMASVVALLTSTKTIPSSGTISAFKVGVYTDGTYGTSLTALAFDPISPGYSTIKTIFIRNDAPSGGKSMNLSMTVTNWNASCSPLNATYNVVTFDFNQTGTVLAPTYGVAANITLTALVNNETQAGLTFSNVLNINIIGTEIP